MFWFVSWSSRAQYSLAIVTWLRCFALSFSHFSLKWNKSLLLTMWVCVFFFSCFSLNFHNNILTFAFIIFIKRSQCSFPRVDLILVTNNFCSTGFQISVTKKKRKKSSFSIFCGNKFYSWKKKNNKVWCQTVKQAKKLNG